VTTSLVGHLSDQVVTTADHKRRDAPKIVSRQFTGKLSFLPLREICGIIGERQLSLVGKNNCCRSDDTLA